MKLEKIFKLRQADLKSALNRELKINGYQTICKPGFLFAQGTHPVLLVAHLDTVHRTPVVDICYSKDGTILMSPQGIGGDDRCGVYMILELIKKVKCSVLFCEDEEIGGVGARLFVESGIKVDDINYIVEFDRKDDDDCVFYDCDNKEFTKFVEAVGFKTAIGSYSDISDIAPHLKRAAVNLSCGYYNAHTLHEYVDLKVVKRNIERALELIMTPSEMFEYVAKIYHFPKRLSGFTSRSSDALQSYAKGWYDDFDMYDSATGAAYKVSAKGDIEEIDEYQSDTVQVLLMPIFEDDGYIIDANGEAVCSDYQFFMDEFNNLYELEVDEKYEEEFFVSYDGDAFKHSGVLMTFDENSDEIIEVPYYNVF